MCKGITVEWWEYIISDFRSQYFLHNLQRTCFKRLDIHISYLEIYFGMICSICQCFAQYIVGLISDLKRGESRAFYFIFYFFIKELFSVEIAITFQLHTLCYMILSYHHN